MLILRLMMYLCGPPEINKENSEKFFGRSAKGQGTFERIAHVRLTKLTHVRRRELAHARRIQTYTWEHKKLACARRRGRPGSKP